MEDHPAVLFLVPPGWPELVAHHEATAGMGALSKIPDRGVSGPRPFLYPPHTVAACAAVARAAGLDVAVLDMAGRGSGLLTR
jgi:hypothetical protein